MIVQAVIEQSGAFAGGIDALLMTSAPLPLQIVRHLHNYPRFANRFNQIDKAFCEARHHAERIRPRLVGLSNGQRPPDRNLFDRGCYRIRG
jgi:hypothetical protein